MNQISEKTRPLVEVPTEANIKIPKKIRFKDDVQRIEMFGRLLKNGNYEETFRIEDDVKLVDGRESLPQTIPSPSGRHVKRLLESKSSPAWSDSELLNQLDNLHVQVIMEFAVKLIVPARGDIKSRMIELRPKNKTEELTEDELFSLYVACNTTKDRLICADFQEQLKSEKTAHDKHNFWLKYHVKKWVPKKEDTLDLVFVKEFVSNVWDITFVSKDSLKIEYSSIPISEIKKYLEIQYPIKCMPAIRAAFHLQSSSTPS